MSQTPASYEPYTPGQPGPEQPSRPSEARSYGGAPDCLVTASVVCVAVWALSGFGYFWPIWVLLPTFLPALLRLRLGTAGGVAHRVHQWPKKQSAAAGVSGHLQRRE